MRSKRAYLGLGSSLGDRLDNLRRALQRLEEPETRLLMVSPIYESPHLGLEPEDAERYPPHLNGVALIETTRSPEALLALMQAVEEAGGRQRTTHWGPRTIDIDILLYDNLRMQNERLTLPHPGIALRAFVARPLADIAPDLILPDGTALRDLLLSPIIQSQHLSLLPDRDLNL